jgi:hypothetical protein
VYNSNKSPTRCYNFSVYYPDVYLLIQFIPQRRKYVDYKSKINREEFGDCFEDNV